MFSMPSLPELLIIGGVVVLLFGARKLPALGGAIGESIRNFKKSIKEDPKTQIGDGSSKSDHSSSEAKSKDA